MTAREFIEGIEGYFGKYPRPAISMTVYRVIEPYTAEARQAIYNDIIATVSTQYGFVPDVSVVLATIEKLNSTTIDKLKLDDKPVSVQQIEDGGEELVDSEEVHGLVDKLTKKGRAG
tara:strand:+ start:1103 stop:1453 length:351 start_codon:yes stop_codon:yes gene_type:complete